MKQAWLTVPRPKRSSGINHQDAVFQDLYSHHTADVEAQETKLKGSTMIRINLMRELIPLSKAVSSPVNIKTDTDAASELVPSREESLPLASSSSFASAMHPPGPSSPAPCVSDPARRSLDSLSSCSDLPETKAVFRSPSLEATSTRLLALHNLGFIDEARLLELHGILLPGVAIGRMSVGTSAFDIFLKAPAFDIFLKASAFDIFLKAPFARKSPSLLKHCPARQTGQSPASDYPEGSRSSPGVTIDAIRQALLESKPKPGSGLKHHQVAFQALTLALKESIERQEADTPGLTLLQIRLVKGLTTKAAARGKNVDMQN